MANNTQNTIKIAIKICVWFGVIGILISAILLILSAKVDQYSGIDDKLRAGSGLVFCYAIMFFLATIIISLWHNQKVKASAIHIHAIVRENADQLKSTRNKLRIEHRILLSLAVPAIVICLPFIVDVGEFTNRRTDPASNHPLIWLGVIVLITSYEWFLWNRPRGNMRDDE